MRLTCCSGRRRLTGYSFPGVFLLFLLQACSQMASQYGIKPAVSYDISGKVQDEMYSSIDGTYQIRIPSLIKPGAKISDQRMAENYTSLSISDDLCRAYFVFEANVGPEVTLDAYVEDYLNKWINQNQATIIERRRMDTSFGQGLLVRTTLPKGAPCIQISFVDGKRKDEKPDADTAMIFVKTGIRIYHFGYVVASGIEMWPGMKTKPAETLLMEFFAGFKPLK